MLVAVMGPAPFLEAPGLTDGVSLAAGLALTALTTLCCAWRWRVVADCLGIRVRLPSAVAAYYRSQLLNATLPGGVLGDVHRGVRHGRGVGAVGLGLRAVAWERSLGQGVQLMMAVLVLFLLTPKSDALAPMVGVLFTTTGVALALLAWTGRRRGAGPVTQAATTLAADLRGVVDAGGRWFGVVLASALVVVGHTGMFLVAAHTAGVSASVERLLPVAMVVLVASAVPMNIAGWGPREGAAAWAFGAAGLDAAQGVTTAVVFGLMALAGVLPGAVVLAATRWHRAVQPAWRENRPPDLLDRGHG